MRRFRALLIARFKEFYRDRGTMAWTFLFPFLVILGFSFAFSGAAQDQYRFAVYDPSPTALSRSTPALRLKHVTYVPVDRLEEAIEKVGRHQYDLLIAPRERASDPGRYWVNPESPKGYFAERLLGPGFERRTVPGRAPRYVDWLIPGMLAMNMMFSALYGVGYTIVRYRRNGVLKRLRATPVRAFEFLCAQVTSRMLIIQAVGVIVYAGCDRVVDFQMRGSYLDLFAFMSAGAFCLISLSTVIAARISSEELAEGLLNVISWPMVFFSGVWFSLEGANPALRALAQAFPLTHIVDGARAIMIDGARLPELASHLGVLGAMAALFLGLGSALFKWS